MTHKTPTLHIPALLLLILVLLGSCAKQGYPSGGPKDVTPPVILSSTPANGTLQFGSSDIYLATDEYVTVKDADNNILISPPMKHKPEYVTRGHGLLIKIKDTLQPNSTYLFQFRGAIVDYNEGNPLPNFEYVFSTGSKIDSMMISGEVLDALTLSPRKEPLTVIAYSQEQLSAADTLGDSLVAYLQPRYITRCDAQGHFTFNHIAHGQYRIIAIEDADKDLRYSPVESIAYTDTLLSAIPMPKPMPADTLRNMQQGYGYQGDSTQSTTAADTMPQFAPMVSLRIAQPTNIIQHVEKAEFTGKGHLQIITSAPLSPSFDPHDSCLALMKLWTDNGRQKLYGELSATRDTVTLWTAYDAQCDSLVMLIADAATGIHDTLSLRYRPKKKNPYAHFITNNFKIKTAIKGSHPYFDTLWVTAENPIKERLIKQDSIVQVFSYKDSSTIIVPLCQVPNSRNMYIDFKGIPGQKYQFKIPRSSFSDIWGNIADSLVFTAEYTKPEQYGNIYFNITSQDSAQLVVELLSEKGEVQRSQILRGCGKVAFAHLKGGKYRVRAFFDTDCSGTWTTVDYYKHRHPERVVYYEKTLDLRENWDIEEKWSL